MAQGTDLFNSTKGQYGEYTTLIGGTPPDTSNWFLETYLSLDNITPIDGGFAISEGLAITGSPENAYGFFQNQKTALKNCATLVRYFGGSGGSLANLGVFGRVASGDFVYAYINGATNQLSIKKRVSSVDTELASVGSVTLDNNLDYWLLFITIGSLVRAELWSTDPREGGTPTAQVTTTLSGADATTFNVSSKIGIIDWTPKSSDARIKSIEVGTAFADQTSRITTALAKQHVDIRDFINYRYPIRYRTIGELNEYNITEKAFSQTITVDTSITSGTFSLYFYPSDTDPYTPIQILSLDRDTSGNRLPFSYDATNQQIKDALNADLNALPRFSVTNEDPIQNVENKLSAAERTLMVEFSESFGEISLLRMSLADLEPFVISEENYESSTEIGTFYPTIFDSQKYIETADPINKQLTLDDLRIEYKFKNENWKLYSGSGGTDAPSLSYFRENSDLIVGKIPSQGYQRGATLKFARAMKRAEKNSTPAGRTWSVHLQSFSKAVNCKTIGESASNSISVVFSDYPWNSGSNESVLDIGPTGCYIQFTSHPLGLFADQNGEAAADSDKVYFDGHLFYQPGTPVNSRNVEFVAPMTDFENGNSFDFSRVTGVRILFKSNMLAVESSLNVMAIRAIPNIRTSNREWVTAEVNTLEQNISYPILSWDQSTAQLPPMVSGAAIETIASDPSPIDSRQSMIFQTGVGGGNFNRFMLFGREQEFESAVMSSWLTAEYAYSSTPNSYLKRYKTFRVKSAGSPNVYWDTHPGGVFEDEYSPTDEGISALPALAPESNYEFAASFQANNISAQIIQLTSAEQPQTILFDAPGVSSGEWMPASGRIGWYVEFADKDVAVTAFDLESAAYALLRTKQFVSETPVEGAQLFTVDSGDKNLFEKFSPLSPSDRVYIDNQKTASGLGSFAFQSYGQARYPGVISNQFTVNDWSHLYIEFDIWVPRDLRNPEKRPRFALRPVEQPEGTSGADVFSGLIPINAPLEFEFISGAWSHVSFDMRGTNAKNGDYYLTIFSNGDGLAANSTFRNTWWIDNVKINTQTVEWEMRAIENGSWTPFRKNVNRQYGALHLSENQIGRNVQLQAKALTEDAWVAEYTLIPKYISPGRILDALNIYSVVGRGFTDQREKIIYGDNANTMVGRTRVGAQMNDASEKQGEFFVFVGSVGQMSASDFFIPSPA